MSRDFIGSKIAVITKSQCRYVGTIIGIDAQTSSILLGNVKCFGTENRPGQATNGHAPGTILPITQFANSDIEDLKIVSEDQTPEVPQQQQQQQQQKSHPTPLMSSPASSSQPPLIHDDPAIVSAVVSSSNKDHSSNASASSRLIHNLQHMTLSDDKSKTLPKNEESRLGSNSGELGQAWSLLSSSTWENNNSKPSSSHQSSGNKSKFFDDFISDKLNNTNQFQSDRSHQRSTNTHSTTQTSRENGGQYNGQYDDSGLPVRQPFFSNDRPYPAKQQQQQQLNPYQQQNRYQNGNSQQNQQRYFYNNRRPQMPNQQRRVGGGGNRETFQNNLDDYEDDFDFETSNQKFNKLTADDDLKNPAELANEQYLQRQIDADSPAEYPPLYDKKKSFFDNLAATATLEGSSSHMFNRSKNSDTFGNNGGYQRQNNYRSNGNAGGYRRSNPNYRQQQNQYGNDDYYYRQNNNNNNNGYHNRY